ncbi:hypothetical protein CDD81_7884 [Ophiocordyceps australis]|uniref:Neutral ceramidase n=1 Tax=Ophiocordyceps australis TaxID=1399860 RepID=A0A2C5YHB4_9HYPO|nr:hypothetical protein CDD81_7884 [Ophiocordyceps australis]
MASIHVTASATTVSWGLRLHRLAVLALLLFCSTASCDLASSRSRQGSFNFNFGGNSTHKHNSTTAGDKYLIGVGKADITGPVVEIGLAGYAQFQQLGSGLRQRLYSRSFIIGSVDDPNDRIVYTVLDNLVGDTAVRFGVLEGLAASGSTYAIYGQHNIALAATHSHSAPGAFWNYFIPQIPTLGFDRQSYQAIVDGALLSIKRAHENIQEGYLDVDTVEITDAAINRSLFAYLNNPPDERAQYSAATDTTMTLLRFRRASDMKNVAALTWFPVHGTSLYNNNTHVAGDNKGLAAWMVEQAMQGQDSAAEGFIAAFSQANLADATPNIEGAWCEDGSGVMCDFENATCADGKVEQCHGRGPNFREQDLGLLASMDSSATPITGPTVKSFHFYHNMKFWTFNLPDGTLATTCPAALGYSFGAGTTDGPGLFDFTQGESGDPKNPLWQILFGLIKKPSARQQECQAPKPILFDAGEISIPYAWEPNIVDVQLFRVGQMVMILSPSEVTTMSGRRWKAAVGKEAATFLDKDPIVVLASPANTYAHYLATPEEYEVQRYEGASTLYGRHELDAYINLTVSNMNYLTPESTERPKQGELPPDNRERSLHFIPGVIYDSHPLQQPFGEAVRQPEPQHQLGDVVKATFQGANPRNNLRLEGTFAAVEKQGKDDEWTRVRDDEDWFLVYTWRRTNGVLGYSEVDVSWETKGNAEPGTYRLKYYGDAKSIWGGITAFEGTSAPFTLVA